MKGGEIFVKKSPAANILSLAKTLARMKNRELNFKVIGKFPGEKLHEVLISEEEMLRTQDMGGYFVVHPWWETSKYEPVCFEYESSTDLIDDTHEIEMLIKSSDEEFNNIGYRAGEFTIL
jgi:UDP-N-acetylglucosamine 4,6-dehydratase/5-epimerase